MGNPRGGKRRTQALPTEPKSDLLDDSAFVAKKALKSLFDKPKLIDQPFTADWQRPHNHRVPVGKKVFGNITYGEVERAIWHSNGMLSNVARDLGLSVHYVKTILSKYKMLRQDFEEFREVLIDEAETCLREKIQRGDTVATIFFLKCVGKRRGYIETEKAGKGRSGNVKMKIVPATHENIKKAAKKDKSNRTLQLAVDNTKDAPAKAFTLKVKADG